MKGQRGEGHYSSLEYNPESTRNRIHLKVDNNVCVCTVLVDERARRCYSI